MDQSSTDQRSVQAIMTHLWSPLAAVSCAWQGRRNVQIAVAIGAASIVPTKPRVAVQIYKSNFSHDMIYRSGAFALNFLKEDQLQLISDFGMVSGRDRDKLSGVVYGEKSSGSPVLEECWGFLDCRVINAMDGGDMTCFLADVLDGKTLAQGDPLWWRDARRQLPPEWMARWNEKQSSETATSRATMDDISHKPWQPRNKV